MFFYLCLYSRCLFCQDPLGYARSDSPGVLANRVSTGNDIINELGPAVSNIVNAQYALATLKNNSTDSAETSGIETEQWFLKKPSVFIEIYGEHRERLTFQSDYS